MHKQLQSSNFHFANICLVHKLKNWQTDKLDKSRKKDQETFVSYSKINSENVSDF